MEDRRRELDALLRELGSISAAEAAAMRQKNDIDWIYSVLRISGSMISRGYLCAILDGDSSPAATIEEVMLARACEEIRKEFSYMADFDTRLDRRQLAKLERMLLSEETEPAYRGGSAFIDEIPYNAPAPKRIEPLLGVFEQETGSKDHYADAFTGAVRTHDMIMSIWPYEKMNDVLAYVAMSYELLLAGLPLPALSISREEHLALASEFFKKGRALEFETLVLASLCEQCRR